MKVKTKSETGFSGQRFRENPSGGLCGTIANQIIDSDHSEQVDTFSQSNNDQNYVETLGRTDCSTHDTSVEETSPAVVKGPMRRDVTEFRQELTEQPSRASNLSLEAVKCLKENALSGENKQHCQWHTVALAFLRQWYFWLYVLHVSSSN